MEETLLVELELKELKWKDLYEPNLTKRANMEDLYKLNLNETSKNEKPLSVKVKLKIAEMEDLYYVRVKMEGPLSVQLKLKELK